MSDVKKNLTSEKTDVEAEERPPLSPRLLLRSLTLLGGWWPFVALSLVLVTITVWADMQIIAEIKILIDREDLGQAGPLAVVMTILGLALINRVCGGTQWLVGHYATNRALEELRRRFFHKLQALSKSFFDSHKAGWLVARNTGDMQVLGQFLTFAPMMVAIFFTTVGFSWSKIYSIDPILLLPTVIVVPGYLWVVANFKRKMSKAQRATRAQNSRLVANLSETVRGIRVVHAFSREKQNLEHYDQLNQESKNLEMDVARLSGLFMPTLDFMGRLNLMLVVGLVAYLVAHGHKTPSGNTLTPGDIVAYFGYMNVILFPMRMMVEIYSLSLSASAAAERIFEVIDMPPSVADQETSTTAPALRGEITLDHIDFRYGKDDPWVLKDLDLHIPAGETLAIVGETGAGKTTMASLVARFYDPTEGAVRIDGTDIRDWTQESLHRQMGVVLQQGYLFTGTIMDNLRFACPDTSPEDVIAVARLLGTDDALRALPQGYDTRVKEGGGSLSLGQRQLVSMTRAVAANPCILIFDEPTSSLDIQTERLIQQALDIMTRDRTTIVIAHRLSTVRNADRILVLNQGRIVESGSHEQLVAQQGHYARLVKASTAENRLGGM